MVLRAVRAVYRIYKLKREETTVVTLTVIPTMCTDNERQGFLKKATRVVYLNKYATLDVRVPRLEAKGYTCYCHGRRKS